MLVLGRPSGRLIFARIHLSRNFVAPSLVQILAHP